MVNNKLFFFAILALFQGCDYLGHEDPDEIIYKANQSFAKADFAEFEDNISKLNDIDFPLSRADIFSFYKNESRIEISLLTPQNSFYLISRLSLDGDRACICHLYMLGLNNIFYKNKISRILDDKALYQQAVLMLKRSAEECNDFNSVMLRSLLVIGKGIGFGGGYKKSLNASPGGQDLYRLEKGMMLWIMNDYDLAYEYFVSVENSHLLTSEANEIIGRFMRQYDVYKSYYGIINEIREGAIRSDKLASKLKKELGIKDSEIEDLFSIGSVDIGLFVLEHAGIKDPPISRAASGVGNILTLIDIFQAVSAIRSAYDTRSDLEREKEHLEKLTERKRNMKDPRDKEEMIPDIDVNTLESLSLKILSNSTLRRKAMAGGCKP
ncbi:hypothetical protein [Endothiovibrio diazotrophicus]